MSFLKILKCPKKCHEILNGRIVSGIIKNIFADNQDNYNKVIVYKSFGELPLLEQCTFGPAIVVIKKSVHNIFLSLLSKYRIVASASPSYLEAHVGLFRLLMRGIFDP